MKTSSHHFIPGAEVKAARQHDKSPAQNPVPITDYYRPAARPLQAHMRCSRARPSAHPPISPPARPLPPARPPVRPHTTAFSQNLTPRPPARFTRPPAGQTSSAARHRARGFRLEISLARREKAPNIETLRLLKLTFTRHHYYLQHGGESYSGVICTAIKPRRPEPLDAREHRLLQFPRAQQPILRRHISICICLFSPTAVATFLRFRL